VLLQTIQVIFFVSQFVHVQNNHRDTVSTITCPRTNITQHQHLTEQTDSMEHFILSPRLGKPSIQSFVHGAPMDEVAGFGFDSEPFEPPIALHWLCGNI